MSFEAISPNMSLVLPGVGQTLSPTWATDLNNSLTIIDGHNHTAGYGVPVPSSGININADLSMNSNNLIAIKSSRYAAQSILAGPSDLNCIFVNGVDLYYNDGVGNHVRLTQSGGVAGTPGSISNLTSPASASYVAGNQTFVWQSDANTPANMDNASIILRNLTANSFGLTLNPPVAMGADFNLTLPTLPNAQKIMTLDAAGNMSAPYSIDGVTLEIAANVIQVKNTNIATVITDVSTSPAQSDYLVDTNTNNANITITLQTAVGGSRPITIKKISTDSHSVFLATTGGQTIDGVVSGVPQLSAPGDSITVQADGTNYVVVARYSTPLRASYTRTFNQSLSNGVLTLVGFNSGTGSGITLTGSGSVNINYDGYYSIASNLAFAQNATGDRILLIDRNGTFIAGQTISGISSSLNNYLSASIPVVACVAGDVISTFAQQQSGGGLDLIASPSNINNISLVRVGPIGDV